MIKTADNTVTINDDLKQLELETFFDLSGADLMKIKYQKPNGDTGSLTVTLTDGTKMIYNYQSGDLDMLGVWNFQAYIEQDGKKAHGLMFSLTIINHL